ncbi:BREX-1 system phosphatase PglZ type A [Endozoicomonas sp. OPT23]|uniref:BREX-1 system phosphatase PglZ type A n=1 Tax=Endozoicomonas sp. OPT23 TaxID=2072845 RepID=UPI00129B55DB|nr:BREX-1 system phosphatase PglZ type A [Endozoicomonas sp. OPT23]MRI34245.1 BREX-1 system phosphatase PglZ type A [Endozoicomonas sp. OPT23]
MNIEQLKQGLEAKFQNHRVVFWYDPEESFKESIESLLLPEVTVLTMDGLSTFEVKKRIELDEPESRFLLYFADDLPDPESDWLLDIRLYSTQFYADASSMLLNELGISQMSLRRHIQQRQSFFASRKRLDALKQRVDASESESTLDLKMMAVLVGTESSGFDEILLKLFFEYADTFDSESNTQTLCRKLEKQGFLPALFSVAAEQFGYISEEPSLSDLLLKLFSTELWDSLEGDHKNWLNSNVLPTASGRATAIAFMSGWRDSRRFAKSYDKISADLENKLDVASNIRNSSLESLLNCSTFESVEQAVIKYLVTIVLTSDPSLTRSQFDNAVSQRMTGHWCLIRPEYTAIYQALKAASDLFEIRKRYNEGFAFESIEAIYSAYESDLYRFDQFYRLFNEHADKVQAKGADILRQLDEAVEELYCNWYLFELGLTWDRLLEQQQTEQGSIDYWRIAGTLSQQDFFRDQVKSALNQSQVKRVFVVVSDALRYEVAEELSRTINGHKRFKAELGSQQGVLPSYTQLGMASLLPHKELAYDQRQNATVFVDGQSSAGLENRNKILVAHQGMAVSAKELLGWSNQEGREKIRDANVVYIYHDTIDATGDKAATEDKTLKACRDAIGELEDLVGRIINRLNASRVVLTADHGFLFRQQALVSADKTALTQRPDSAFEAKKRYILGTNLPSEENCWKGSVSVTAGTSCDTGFLLPKGVNRFHFMGGARFVHGGAMPQEICVPVMVIKPLQKQQAEKKTRQKVGAVAASQPIKLVNNIDTVRFLQTDAVSELFIPRSLVCSIINAQGNTVSSEETVVFDSASDNMADRTREARLKLIGSDFDRTAVYTLKLVDAETNMEYSQYSVNIDLAFEDDFF